MLFSINTALPLSSSSLLVLLVVLVTNIFTSEAAFTTSYTANIPLCHSKNTRKTTTFLPSSHVTAFDATPITDTNNNEEEENFESLGLTNELLSSVEIQGWSNPTPIQRLVIPAILQQLTSNTTSVWAEAPTGSGKTAAFVLPLLQLTMDRKKQDYKQKQQQQQQAATGIQTLMVVPTRELALQIGGVVDEVLEGLSNNKNKKNKYQNVNVIIITGGVPIEPQIQQLIQSKQNHENVDIVIATPGRLVDVLMHHSADTIDTSKTSNLNNLNAQDAELEKRLLNALEDAATTTTSSSSNEDTFLKLSTIDDLGINTIIEKGDDGYRSSLRDMINTVEYLVFDEADRLLGQTFQKEMDELLQLFVTPEEKEQDEKPTTKELTEEEEFYAIVNTPSSTSTSNNNVKQKEGGNIKTLLFSATFPYHIQPRVEKVLQRLNYGYKKKDMSFPKPLRLSCSSVPSLQTGKKVTPQQIGPESTINIRTIRIDEKDRTQALKKLLQQHGITSSFRKKKKNVVKEEKWESVLVFVATRYSTQHVATKLRRANIPALELHGKLSHEERTKTLQRFKNGQTSVLIATDLASRGLDIRNLSCVINYDLPRSTVDFIHRIGRTGRAGLSGTAISFVSGANVGFYRLIEKRHLQKNNYNHKSKEEWEVIKGFEPNEEKWLLESELSKATTTTASSSVIDVGGIAEVDNNKLAHDQMYGGIKGKRKSKKDKLREKAILENLEP